MASAKAIADRRVASSLVLLLLLVPVSQLAWAPLPRLPNTVPNILLIVTDDQPVGTLKVMPQTRHHFVERGRRYTRGFVTTPLCCPSRVTIFSGRYAHNHGTTSNSRAARFDHRLTIQRYLHDAGYATGIVGKYLNGVPIDDAPPHFDKWAIVSSGDHNEFRANINGLVRPISRYSTTFLKRRSLKLLTAFETADEQPWFLTIATRAPHAPYTPQRRYANAPVPRWHIHQSSRETDRSDKPPWVRKHNVRPPRARVVRAQQLRMLMSVDDLIAAIFKRLRRLDENERTLAIFISDNGLLYGDHGLGQKGLPYMRSIKVPFMIRWPNVVPIGRDSRWAANVDIAPTIMQAARLVPAVPMDGNSLLGSEKRPHLFTEFMRDIRFWNIPAWASLRTGRYQYVEYYGDGHIVFREYYDLRTDVAQLTNLLHDGNPSNNPPTRRARRLIQTYRSCAGDTCP